MLPPSSVSSLSEIMFTTPVATPLQSLCGQCTYSASNPHSLHICIIFSNFILFAGSNAMSLSSVPLHQLSALWSSNIPPSSSLAPDTPQAAERAKALLTVAASPARSEMSLPSLAKSHPAPTLIIKSEVLSVIIILARVYSFEI